MAAVLGLVAVLALAGYLLLGPGAPGYEVRATFLNGSALVNGNPVQIAGVQVGKVEDLNITPLGQAEATLSIDEEHAPLPQGTRATIRLLSLTGIANRYIDLQLPEGQSTAIANGGEIKIDQTTTAVDIDELFNTLDPVARVAVQEFFKGQARQIRGRGDQANAGLRYLNPALATSSRLFNELNRDTPLLAEFLEESDQLTSAVAERRDDLTEVITRFNVTTRALGNKRVELIEALERFPDFMRLANTTFVNLRGTLDEVDPLVEASKPVAKKLPAFFAELRPFARDARPTLRDLRNIVRRSGKDNDLVELNRTLPPLARTALDPVTRNGEERLGAFPEIAKSLRTSAPTAAKSKPGFVEFAGWQDDFSHPGGYDAIGAYASSVNYINPFENASGIDADDITQIFAQIRGANEQIEALETQLGIPAGGEIPSPLPSNPVNDALNAQTAPIREALAEAREQRSNLLDDTFVDIEDITKNFLKTLQDDQTKRCPGGAEEAAPDGSNVLSEEDRSILDCEEDQRAVGEY